MKKYGGPLQMYEEISEAEDSLTSESSYLYQKWTPPSFDDHGWIAITPSQVSSTYVFLAKSFLYQFHFAFRF